MFSKSDKVSHHDAKVAGQLKCTNASGTGFGSTTGFGHPGGTQSHEKYVYSADGLQLGAILITASCAPIGIEGQY